MVLQIIHASFLVSLVFFTYNISLVNCNTFRKCCESDKGLREISLNDTIKYVCSSKFEKNVLPLIINNLNDIIIGMPEECGEESCTDKTIDGLKVIQLSCDTTAKVLTRDKKIKETNLLVKLPTIYKCCPQNMFYNESTKSCMKDCMYYDGITNSCVNDTSFNNNFIFDSSASVYNKVYGMPLCNMAVVDHNYDDDFTINDGILTLKNTKIFKNGTYCIDRSRKKQKILIRTCEYKMDVCRTMPCIPKCCPAGQKLFKNSKTPKSTCKEDLTIPFYSKFSNVKHEPVGIPDKMAILVRGMECKRYMEQKFILFDNGSLSFKKSVLHGVDHTYCVEYFDGPGLKGYIALICFPNPTVKGLHNFFYLAGLLISIIFLAITLTIYFFLPELQNLHGRTVMSHSTSLLASYIILAMVKKPITAYALPTCLILAYGIMYTFLVAFSWLNVMCFDIWYTFGVVKARGMKKNKDLKKFLLYSLYAYGIPLILTGITLYIDLFSDVPDHFKPNFAKASCWFDLRDTGSHWPFTIFFAIPVGIIIFFNIVLFILTVRHCLKVRGDIQRMQHADSPKKRRFFTDKATLIMNFKLFIVMGISWTFEVMSMYVREPIWLWYFLDSINVLQGLWIFFIFVLKSNVWKALRKKLGYQVLREGSQTQSTAMSAKNSVGSTTSIRLNGINKSEDKNLLQKILRNSTVPNNERQ